jgi:hypothetical protein
MSRDVNSGRVFNSSISIGIRNNRDARTSRDDVNSRDTSTRMTISNNMDARKQHQKHTQIRSQDYCSASVELKTLLTRNFSKNAAH